MDDLVLDSGGIIIALVALVTLINHLNFADLVKLVLLGAGLWICEEAVGLGLKLANGLLLRGETANRWHVTAAWCGGAIVAGWQWSKGNLAASSLNVWSVGVVVSWRGWPVLVAGVGGSRHLAEYASWGGRRTGDFGGLWSLSKSENSGLWEVRLDRVWDLWGKGLLAGVWIWNEWLLAAVGLGDWGLEGAVSL